MKDRQKKYLFLIIKLYIKTGIPVGSKTLLDEYKLDISPATIRNTMFALEKEGYLQKAHVSSGRIPSTKGFQYYAQNVDEFCNDTNKLEARLNNIFLKRNISIDTTLDEALKAINEMIGVTLVASDQISDDLLKSIQLIMLNESEASIILVTSSGYVNSKKIDLSYIENNVNDIKVAIRIFKDSLIDTPLRDLVKKAISLKPILSQNIKNIDSILNTFVSQVFDFNFNNKIIGKNEIIQHKEFSREKLAYILDLIEHHSIWEMIESQYEDENDVIKIDVREDNVSLISKKIPYNNTYKEVSVIGSNRIDYVMAKQALELLEKFLAKKSKEDNKKNK